MLQRGFPAFSFLSVLGTVSLSRRRITAEKMSGPTPTPDPEAEHGTESHEADTAPVVAVPLVVRFRTLLTSVLTRLRGWAAQAAESASGSQELQSARADLKTLLLGWMSRDRRTRHGILVFWGSLILLGVVASHGWRSYTEFRHLQKYGMNEADLSAKLRAENEAEREKQARLHTVLVTIGAFNIELAPPKGGQRLAPGVMNMAEIEITLECETRDACETIQARMVETRNQITNALTPLERDELLSRDGKGRIKRRVIDRVNAWLTTEGKVRDLYFSRLLLT